MRMSHGIVRIAHGVDVVEVDRFRDLLKRWKERALERLFSEEERAYGLRSGDGAARLAARFAAKEAVLKALGTGLAGGMRWRDVEVVSEASGKPTVRFWGRVKAEYERQGFDEAVLSLSHSRGVAMASVILVGR
jgi:holo-[acyl-carrier protein] synthase